MKLFFTAALTSLALATASYAGGPIITSKDTTTAFVGLNWNFNSGGGTPEAILGLAHGSRDSSNDVDGGKISLHFGFLNGFSVEKMKLTGLFGDDSAQGEMGLGVGFGDGALFGILGFNTDHVHGGVDVNLGGGLEGYLGIHTIGEFDRVALPPA
ncbi:MAG: hypothetical protein HKP40_04850 [Litoreibacter sp.]|nr:hypothetical protein [Litoreibacter sp.]